MNGRNSYIISKGFRHYFGASILYALIEQVCTMLDMVFAGNFVAAEAFSAMDLVLPFETLVTGLMLMLIGGAGTIASKDIGNQHFDSANKVLTIAIASSTILSLLLSALSLIFLDGLVSLLCNDPGLSVYVREYLKVYVIGLVPMSIYIALSQIIDIDGEPKLVTKAVIAGVITDLVLDVVFMKIFGFGVEGVAIATIFSYIVPTLLYVPYLTSNKCTFRLLASKKHTFPILKDNITFGLPYAMPYIVTFLMCYFVNSLVLYRYGASGVYVWGVGFQILSMGFMIMDSVGRTVLVTMGSMLYGCSDFEGLGFLVRRCFKVSILSMLVLITFVFLFPGEVAALFGEDSIMSIDSSKWSIKYVSLFLIPYAICCIKAYLAQVLGQKARSSLMFIGLIAFTVAGIIFLTYSDSPNIYLSVPFTGLLFLMLDAVYSAVANFKDKSLSTYFLIPCGDDRKSLFISIPYSDKGLNTALENLEKYLDSCDVSVRLRMDINICCEEMILKIVEYGQNTGKTNGYFFDLFVLEQQDRVKVKIQDAGSPFNPVRKFEKTAAQAYMDGEEMHLSMQILNRLCDELEYNYLYGQNTIYMTFRKVERKIG